MCFLFALPLLSYVYMSGTIKLRSSSVKRIMSELRELQSDDTLDFIVNPIEVLCLAVCSHEGQSI